jgi:Tfp pilus assembly protein FimT
MRRGVTLLELACIIVILGIMSAIMLPVAARPLNIIAVDHAAHQLVRAHMRARMAALRTNQVALLQLTADSLVVKLLDGRDTVPEWKRDGPAADGITLTGPTRLLRFTPTGISFGVSNGTWIVSKGSVTRRVVISRYGRVRVE